ncbi:conserved hypothetical protein [Neospora caninum Liverpool]|uniref:Conserved oligomeric Golgi complex subunit 5 helical domain-containing protein n=1 Tax=Neospora caninum (strain Liverpool) TaxID=572307 RepID=F0VRA6_NEOCL|nr:conserved hypothetical protein [Neospora caninum Liverpool]CBZ56254.1 conserved hypothetical protein [Neospora caninum Liverpool]CEL71016.1 TPA: hypothetical protein BN1204_066790 [Neospora caninum Liverpool]|eukprot:XP_003886279.1 conserved hypothetical protein [Neospora caninum Liverpool]
MTEETGKRRSSARERERAEALVDDSGDVVEIGDVLRCLDAPTVDLVHQSLAAGAGEALSPLVTEKATSFPHETDGRGLAAGPSRPTLKSDALNVAEYVHRVVGRGDEAGGGEHVAAAVRKLDVALGRLDEEMKKAAALSRDKRGSGKKGESAGGRRRDDRTGNDGRPRPTADVPALSAFLMLLGSEGEERGESEKEEEALQALLHDSGDEKGRTGRKEGDSEAGLGSADGRLGAVLVEQAKQQIQDLYGETKNLQTDVDRLYQGVEGEIRVASRLLLLQEVVCAMVHFVSIFKRLRKEDNASTRAALVSQLLALLREPHRVPASGCSAAVCTPQEHETGNRARKEARSQDTDEVLVLADLQSLAPFVSLVNKEACQLRTATRQQLLEAVDQGSPLALSSALDVFFLLDQLWEQVEALLRNLVSSVCAPISSVHLQKEANKGPRALAASARRVGKENLPSLCRENEFEASLAEAVSRFFERVEDGLKKASLVDQVLAVGEDPLTRQPYTAFLASSGFSSTFSEEVWRASSLHFSAFLRELGAFASLPPARRSSLVAETSRREQRRRLDSVASALADSGAQDAVRSAEDEARNRLEESEERTDFSRFVASLGPAQLAVVEAVPLLSRLLLSFLRRCEEIACAGVLSKAPSDAQTGALRSAIAPLRQVYIHLFAVRLDGVLASLFSPRCLSQARMFLRRVSPPVSFSRLLPPASTDPPRVASSFSAALEKEEEKNREAFARLLQSVEPLSHLPSSPDLLSLVSAAFRELERVNLSSDEEMFTQAVDVVEEAFETLVLLCLCQLHRDGGLEPLVLVDAGARLLRRLPAASPARIRATKVFALFTAVEAAMKIVLEQHSHVLPFLRAARSEVQRTHQASGEEVPAAVDGFCLSEESLEDAEESDEEIFLESLQTRRSLPLLQWHTFREVAAVQRRLLEPVFSSVESAAVAGCLGRLVDEVALSLSSPGEDRAAGRTPGSEGRETGGLDATEDAEQLAALSELERLLCHAQQQYVCLLPPPSLLAPLSSLSLSILETLLGHACVCEARGERERAYVASVVARGEVLLSAFWTGFHKHVRVGSDMLRNVRRLLFADSPFLLHELLTIMPQQEPFLSSERATPSSPSSSSSSSSSSASSSSSPSSSSPSSLVATSLPPLLVACHLLYRLPVRKGAPSRRPHALLGLSGGAPELARLLAAYLRSQRGEKEERPEESRGEARVAAERLRRDLHRLVTLETGGKPRDEKHRGENESEGKRERWARGRTYGEREAERREDLKILVQVARLLSAALDGGAGGEHTLGQGTAASPGDSSRLEKRPVSTENISAQNASLPPASSSFSSSASSFSSSCSPVPASLQPGGEERASLWPPGEVAQEPDAGFSDRSRTNAKDAVGGSVRSAPRAGDAPSLLSSPSREMLSNGTAETHGPWGERREAGMSPPREGRGEAQAPQSRQGEDPRPVQVHAQVGAFARPDWEAENEKKPEPQTREEQHDSAPFSLPQPPVL